MELRSERPMQPAAPLCSDRMIYDFGHVLGFSSFRSGFFVVVANGLPSGASRVCLAFMIMKMKLIGDMRL